MSNKISGAGHSLAKIFSPEFEYVIPYYQRPYAWTVDQASELFDDLYNFFESEPEEYYFLGSIVLIKQESKPLAEVIDGQQRLTTLTILLCSLASILGDTQKDMIYYIQETGKVFEGLEPKPRLTLREKDKEFFAKYVQALNFDGLSTLDDKSLDNESQINIKKNSQFFIKKIKEHLDNNKKREKFIEFLIQRCFLVAVATPSQQSAFRVFSVMNSRGLDLQLTDIIKADTIGKIANEQEREKYNERWEDMEVELGRDGFNDLFTYVRMIHAREKAKKSLLEEFKDRVLPRVSTPEMLISDVLEPFASALATVRSANYKATSDAEQVNSYLRWLNRIDNSDWIPAAILFLSRNKNEPKYVARFFSSLERLAAFMHICALNINKRIERYSHVIKALEEEDHSISSPIEAVELTEAEKEQMLEVLNGNIYELIPRRRNYLILRLNAFISETGASYNTSNLTIEHVLPQTLDDKSEWAKSWPDEKKRDEWVHRIANLVPLNRRRNSQAQNYDFKKKKSAYFKGTKDVSSYALTIKVLNTSEWTPEHLVERQEELLGVLRENWRLGA